MNIKELFKRNQFDKLKIPELQEEEFKLKSRINRLRKEIDKIEKEKKLKFSEGVGADLIKKKMIAQELKQLDMEAKLKVRNFMGMHKQYMFITNLIVIKKYQRELQKTQIWSKIQNISPEVFESSLIKVNLAGKGFDNVLDNLNQIFAMDIADSDSDLDDSEKEMFEIWNNVETGTLDLDEADHMFSIEKDIEKAMEESER
ncbi:chromosome assembly protein [Methanoplanus endosymbiosus]|uniref:Chromosome assembly protein n=1 Tax=Methanoplanus endosymbiosus TaxID=33865 RepID=A0A9E7PNW6_9EURY|nr:chromosome assembly protein [Methanoplanus endosymbiosus]UUX93738.1 chromosome assembly protein [Methanoplanus endosymbiosus]